MEENIYVFDKLAHQIDWSHSMSAYAFEVADFDLDGNVEVLVGKGNGVINAYQGNTHQLKKSFVIGSSKINGILAIEDLDNDGKSDFLVSDESHFFIVTNNVSNIYWQSPDLGGSFLGGLNQLNMVDLDEDLNFDIVAGSSFALYQFEAMRIPLDRILFLPMIHRTHPIFLSGVIWICHFQWRRAFRSPLLDLYYFNGSNWSLKNTTTTDISGIYSYSNLPTLNSHRKICCGCCFDLFSNL